MVVVSRKEKHKMDYVVCWTESQKRFWEVISGLDAMQERISELVYSGIQENEIVVGEITEDVK